MSACQIVAAVAFKQEIFLWKTAVDQKKEKKRQKKKEKWPMEKWKTKTRFPTFPQALLLVVVCSLILRPDKSLATKTGHLDLLRTSQRVVQGGRTTCKT